VPPVNILVQKLLPANYATYLYCMFVRTKKLAGGKTKIQIAESLRENGKVRQKILRHVGTVSSQQELERFMQIAEYIKTDMENEKQATLFAADTLAAMVQRSRRESLHDTGPLPVNLRDIRERHRIVSGIHEIYGSLYDSIGFGSIMRGCPVSAEVMKDIVIGRIARPVSKKATAEFLETDFGIEIPLEKIYRMLDTLSRKNRDTWVQKITWQYSQRLLGNEISILFYDCTTLYFESFTEDELRRFGYSKDHKFNQGQVLLALMVTNEGLPVGYEVFPGDTYEGKTFKIAVNRIKKFYNVKRAIIVADSGLLSRENIELLESENLEYIVGARIRSLSKKWQNRILDNTAYEKLKKEDETLRIAQFQYNKTRKLIVTHSDKRALKDSNDREKAIESLKQKLENSQNPKKLVSNYGYQKYIRMDGDVKVTVDQEKIDKESLWDGLHGIFSNISDLSPQDILSQYHGLWQVEESFRISKHDLRVRPVFHWNANRIRAHIAICYMAFSLIRFLQYKLLHETKARFSPEKIRAELSRVQDSILIDINTNLQYVVPSKPSSDALKIYQTMSKTRIVVPYKLTAI
jgi:transposase